MLVSIIEDAPVLIPNEEHKNFTETGEVIKKYTQVEGEPKNIIGKRRGEEFTYKLFLTNDNKLIHLNKTKNMEKTSGIDTPATLKVNLKQNTLARPTILASISGAVLGFAVGKYYKKVDTKKSLMYALVGAAAGFGVGKFIEHKATITKTK